MKTTNTDTMTYRIFYRVNFYNPYRRYPRNFDRFARCASVTGETATKAVIAEIAAKGYTLTDIYDAAGNRVVFAN